MLFSQAIDLYIANRDDLRPKTAYDYRAVLSNHGAALLSKPVTEIALEDVKAVYNTTKAQSVAQARKLVTYAGTVLEYAINWADLKIGNVFRRFRKISRIAQVKPRTRQLNEETLPVFFDALRGCERSEQVYLLMLLYTSCRKEEIGDLVWSEIDLERGVLSIPGWRRKNHEDLRVVLSEVPLLLLRQYAARCRCPRPDQRLFAPGSLTCYESIVEFTGIDCRPHDLRRTFAAAAEHIGLSSYAIRRLLGHKAKEVTESYVNPLDSTLREYNRAVVARIHFLAYGGAVHG